MKVYRAYISSSDSNHWVDEGVRVMVEGVEYVRMGSTTHATLVPFESNYGGRWRETRAEALRDVAAAFEERAVTLQAKSSEIRLKADEADLTVAVAVSGASA